MSEPSSVQAELLALEAMGRAALASRWEAVFGCPAPLRCRAPFLRQALGWQVQMQAQAPTRQSVSQMLKVNRAPRREPPLATGTELVREWQGRMYRVMVKADGFECDDKSYRSLSAVARAITGTAWSGPLFFGLRS